MKARVKQWTRPQLVILGRGKPEEMVLLVCKTASIGEPGPNKKIPCQDRTGNPCQSAAGS